MGAFWELIFWDFPIEWHLWEFYGKLLGPFWESYGRISQNFGMSQKKGAFLGRSQKHCFGTRLGRRWEHPKTLRFWEWIGLFFGKVP
eukprot:jgi/Botrbrau1/22716/Bobra.0132s0055.1